jgi:ABC-type oligopeptide transport system substrate-binding subunit
MRSAVRFSLAALLWLPAVGCAQADGTAQDQRWDARGGRQSGFPAAQQDQASGASVPGHLASVTWNPVTHELTWEVSKGGAGEPAGTEHYSISLDQATMTYGGKTRRFSQEEATNVRLVMDVIARYAADSTVWWEKGKGEPADGAEPKEQKPANPPKPEESDDYSVALLHTLRTARSSNDATNGNEAR